MVRFEILITEELKQKMTQFVEDHRLISNVSTLLRVAVEDYMENTDDDRRKKSNIKKSS